MVVWGIVSLLYQVACSSIQPFYHNKHMGRKVEGAVPIFRGCDLSPSNNVAWAEAYLRTKWHLEPSRRLATTDMGRKLGVGLPPPLGGKLGPHLPQVASWSIQPFGHNTPALQTGQTGQDRQNGLIAYGEGDFRQRTRFISWTTLALLSLPLCLDSGVL